MPTFPRPRASPSYPTCSPGLSSLLCRIQQTNTFQHTFTWLQPLLHIPDFSTVLPSPHASKRAPPEKPHSLSCNPGPRACSDFFFISPLFHKIRLNSANMRFFKGKNSYFIRLNLKATQFLCFSFSRWYPFFLTVSSRTYFSISNSFLAPSPGIQSLPLHLICAMTYKMPHLSRKKKEEKPSSLL